MNPKDTRNDKIEKEDEKGKKQNFIVHIRYLEGMYSNDGFTSKDDYVINLREILAKSDIHFNPSFRIDGKKKSMIVSDW